MKRIPIYAHRGASAYELENTIEAFEKAKALKADGIELDIQVSKDSILVVFHDMDLMRLAGVRKNINDCTFKELSKYSIGSRFKRILSTKRILSFKQLVGWANRENIALNIELKESLLANTDALKNEIKTLKLPANSHFSSFHIELLKIVKEVRPDFETAILVTKKFNWQSLRDLDYIDHVHAHRKYYKQLYLEACEEAKKGIRFYGIVGRESFLTNPHPAVLGWITDYPDKVRNVQQKNTTNT
ncbi:glycerophosphodiester phosphodiesterase [Solibacillus sp. R5-41]|uniref:glycerophosphodiester phosphodiesterase n=1 Tax=Solibacillus sp. R5-41 TaxID=2048654 RepID=UPI000C1288FE|nr:glycerophosphodiester phosphodiesterase family protein [Solibacillus sp. R5-41]ATP40927.1 glycerophosphodiester phosphodiesterase [Solibacillus sp. R5-41]